MGKLFLKIKENFNVKSKVVIADFGPRSCVNKVFTIFWK